MSFKKLNEGISQIVGEGKVRKVDTAKKLRQMGANRPDARFVNDRLMRIDPSLAKPWYLADRHLLNKPFITTLAQDILKQGQMDPVLAVQVEAGDDNIHFHVVAGQTRWRAAMLAREIDPEAKVHLLLKLVHDPDVEYQVDDQGKLIPLSKDGSDIRRLLVQQRTENEMRRGVSPWDTGRFYNDLIDQGVFATSKELGAAYQVAKGTLSKLKTIAEALPSELMALFPDPELLTVSELYGLATKWGGLTRGFQEKALKEAKKAIGGARKTDNKRIRSALMRALSPYLEPPQPEPGFKIGRGKQQWVANVSRSSSGVNIRVNGDIDLDWFQQECREFLETAYKKAEKVGKSKR